MKLYEELCAYTPCNLQEEADRKVMNSALSREVFASGAVQAARFLAAGQSPGLYSMADLVTYLGL